MVNEDTTFVTKFSMSQSTHYKDERSRCDVINEQGPLIFPIKNTDGAIHYSRGFGLKSKE